MASMPYKDTCNISVQEMVSIAAQMPPFLPHSSSLFSFRDQTLKKVIIIFFPLLIEGGIR